MLAARASDHPPRAGTGTCGGWLFVKPFSNLFAGIALSGIPGTWYHIRTAVPDIYDVE